MRQCLILDFFGTMLVASRAEAWNYRTIHLLAGDGHRIECALGIYHQLACRWLDFLAFCRFGVQVERRDSTPAAVYQLRRNYVRGDSYQRE